MTALAPASLVRALRPRQWIKNVLVLAAPVAAGTLDEPDVLVRALAGVAIFIMASGATYLLNDVVDVAVDRAHPTKRHRPVAAREISVRSARTIAPILALLALAAAFALAVELGLVIAGYLAINAAYSAGLKHVPWLELAPIAAGFILRAVAGGAATDTPLSAWFVVVVCSASLFVVAGKRSAELRRTAGAGGRRVLRHYSAAGLRAFQAATAGSAVVAYALWVVAQDRAVGWLAAVSLLPFTAALARYSAALDLGLGEDPEDIVLGDRVFQLIAAAWVVVYALAVHA